MSFFDRFRNKITEVIRDSGGNFFYLFGKDATFNKLDNSNRIEYVLSNPILMLVLKAKCDLFSLVKIDGFDKEGGKVTNDYLHTKIGNANYYQTWEQFLWEYCFWKSIGSAFLYLPSGDSFLPNTQFYMLKPNNMKFDTQTINMLNKMLETEKEQKELMKKSIVYYEGNSKKTIELKKIKPFFSTSNGINTNWFEGQSMVDSITPILDNVMLALKAQNLNLFYSGKWASTKKNQEVDVHKLNNPSQAEKDDIERKINSNKSFYSLQHDLDIKRFVDDMGNLKLDEQQTQQYFMVGKAFGLSKDFLEASLKGTTYENKAEAIGQVVSQSLQPDIDQLLSFFEQYFGINKLKGSWGHLPFMYTFDKKKQENASQRLENIRKAQDYGANYTESELKEMYREALNG